MYWESNPKVLSVLSDALQSTSRTTRLRAVSMLARLGCSDRQLWLDRACGDADESVRGAAIAVAAWITEPAEPCWPDREDPAFDAIAELVDPESSLEAEVSFVRAWEYSIEVWRHDGLLIGVFLSALCEEDDEHAKRIALGQAILASTRPAGDHFDPELAAAFIVGKRRVHKRTRPHRDHG
jgi:hypothetical protein